MKLEDIKVVASLGTGTMGYGITLLYAMNGYTVKMFGRSDDSVNRGLTNIKAALEMYKNHDLVKEDEIPEILGRITGVTTIKEATEGCDFVIEAIAEDLEVKRKVWKEIEDYVGPDTIFATSTSGLSPTEIQEVLVHPERFVVAHFWNPPHLVPLVEVVPGKQTSQEVVDITWKLIEKIGKKPVALKREALGFIGNRLQLALLREAIYIVEEGIATPEAVDDAVKYSIGRRLGATGPIETADLGGLDIFYNISTYLYEDLCATKEPQKLMADCVAAGTLGAKTGTGMYQWTPEALSAIKQRREEILLEFLQKDKTTKF